MHRNLVVSLLFVALAFAAGASAQSTQPVTGTIELSKNGAKAPLAGAKVDLFRQDIKGQGQSVTTDKDGKFAFAGVQLGQKFVIAVSGPGATPTFLPEIKAGMQNLIITLDPGDGSGVTEDQVIASLEAANASPEEKKRLEELAKQRREVEERNARTEANNKTFAVSLKEGEAAYKAGNYAEAVAKFDMGIDASPDFEGTAPVFLNYKAVALKSRGRNAIIEAQKGDNAAKAAAREQAKPDYELALKSYRRGLEVIEKAPADSPAKEGMATSKKNIYHNYVITLGEMYETAIPVPEDVDASKALAGFIATEPDQKIRSVVLASFGEKAMRGGELDASAMAFRKILESSPNDADALSGAAIAIGALAFMTDPPSKENIQEAMSLGQKFLQSAPKTHKNQEAVQDLMENLKAQAGRK